MTAPTLTARLLPLLLLLLVLPLAACPAPDGGAGDDDDAGTDDDDDAAFTCDGVTPEIIEISPDELDAMMDDDDFELINVHIPYEGEIPGTDVHIAFTDTDGLEDHLGGDVAAKAVLYCKTGPMSAAAAADLVELGYCRIHDLPAGMNGWEDEGYPIDE